MTREEAKEILQGAIKKPNTKDGYLGQAIDMAIKALEQEPCEDAVSRQAVDELCFRFLRANSDDNIAFYEHFLDLPSVTPTRKKGKWMGTRLIGFGEFAECEVELIDGFVADNCHCSECGEELEKGERGIYCPNCGAEMENEEKWNL